eukprot:3449010-Pleurochrysis_carterae.AAC.2
MANERNLSSAINDREHALHTRPSGAAASINSSVTTRANSFNLATGRGTPWQCTCCACCACSAA